jgi:transaldolase
MPEATLKSYADHGKLEPTMPPDGGACETVLARLTEAGVNLDDLAARLQDEGAKSFAKSWKELMDIIAERSDAIRRSA